MKSRFKAGRTKEKSRYDVRRYEDGIPGEWEETTRHTVERMVPNPHVFVKILRSHRMEAYSSTVDGIKRDWRYSGPPDDVA